MKRRLTLPSSALLSKEEEDPRRRKEKEEEEGLASISSNHSTGCISINISITHIFDAGKRKRKVEEEAERRRREERAEEERRVQERIILISKNIINVKSFIIDIHSRRFWTH